MSTNDHKIVANKTENSEIKSGDLIYDSNSNVIRVYVYNAKDDKSIIDTFDDEIDSLIFCIDYKTSHPNTRVWYLGWEGIEYEMDDLEYHLKLARVDAKNREKMAQMAVTESNTELSEMLRKAKLLLER